MFTGLLCQLSSGSSNVITTLECSETLSGSSYLPARSPGQLTSVKNIHQQNTTQIQITWDVGREASLAFLFPCHCSLQFHKLYLFFPQALPHLGQEGDLESGVLPTGRLYLQTWKDVCVYLHVEGWPHTTATNALLARALQQQPETEIEALGLSLFPAWGSLYLFIAAPTAVHTMPRGCCQRFHLHCANTTAPFLRTG